MTSPTIHTLYDYIRQADGPVYFTELRDAFPAVPKCKIRSRCMKLVHQGYIAKLYELDAYVGVR